MRQLTWKNPSGGRELPALAVEELTVGDKIRYAGEPRVIKNIQWRRHGARVWLNTNRYVDALGGSEPGMGWIIAPAEVIEEYVQVCAGCGEPVLAQDRVIVTVTSQRHVISVTSHGESSCRAAARRNTMARTDWKRDPSYLAD